MEAQTGELKHLPYIEALSKESASSSGWHAKSAGLLTLRIVDAWLENGVSRSLSKDGWSVPAVRDAIDEITEQDNLRGVLHGIVDSVMLPKAGLRGAASKLMAYGQLLEYDAEWALAGDVYTTIVAHAHPSQESDLATFAHLRSGFCLRQLGQITESVQAYRTAGEIATKSGDLIGVLRSRIGEAKAAIARGNLPQADDILRATVDRAVGERATEVQSMALADRAMVAGLRGDFELAVRFGYDALELSRSPRERDRILGDIATAFRKLGVLSAAHDAYVILAATAQEQYGRWAATLNLMELAADEGKEVVYEQYTRSLAGAELAIDLRVSYLAIRGTAASRFGRPEEARTFLESAIALAEEHDLNQFAFEARAKLEALATGVSARSTVEAAQVSEIAHEVARLLESQREALNV